MCSFRSLTRSHFSSSSSGSMICIVGSLTAGLGAGSGAEGVGASSTGASFGAGTGVGVGAEVGRGNASEMSSTSLLSSATGAHGPLSSSPRSS